MKIGTNYSLEKPQQGSNFGALYMPKMTAVVENERPWLEHLAQDVDIFIQPTKDKTRLRIFVQEITPPVIGSWFKRARAKRKYLEEINSKPHYTDVVSTSIENLGANFYKTALSLKLQYNNFFHPRVPAGSITPSVVRIIPTNNLPPKTPTPIRKAS